MNGSSAQRGLRCLAPALALALGLTSAGCGPRPARKPAVGLQPVLDLPFEGVMASDQVVIGHDRRRALLGTARFRAHVPRSALLSFALAAVHSGEDAPRGFVRLSVRVDGEPVGERRTNPRTSPGFRATSLSFEGPGCPALLELDLALVDGRGQPIPVPAGVRPVAADLSLVDRDALPDRRAGAHRPRLRRRREHSSWTLPAHFTMMTSVEPAAHGAVHSKVGFNYRVPTLAAILRGRGFRTHAITSAADVAHVKALYGGEIRYTDGQLNRVLEHLAKRGLARHTLLLVTSDHGEAFLEHGTWSHGHRLYEELVRIPLLLHGPGVPTGRVPQQVSLMDLAPTVLGWLGLPPQPEHRGRSLLGRLEDREAFGETANPKGMQRLFLRAGHDRWKVVLEVDRRTSGVIAEEWYDLGRDPGETVQAPPPAAAAEAIRRRLVALWSASGREADGTKVDLSPTEIEQLRAVGYLQN